MIPFFKTMVHDIVPFVQDGSGLQLRSYQIEAARAIVKSVVKRRGLTFVVIMARQAGKNELQAQLENYLLTLFADTNAEIVKAAPTKKPQSMTSLRRLKRVLESNVFTASLGYHAEQDYILRVGSARIYFLSAAKTANVVSHTASTLLECDEAQDVRISKWDKDFDPMAASTDATRVFYGTVWTSRTLLAREKAAALQAEAQDGIRRVFMFDANAIAAEVPAYGRYVEKQVAKLGRQHPMVKTQLFLEELDAEGGMFPEWRRQLMQGSHPPLGKPTAGKLYAALLDVAGEDESQLPSPSGRGVTHHDADVDQQSVVVVRQGGEGSTRDSTALTIVEVDISTVTDDALQAPTYRVVHRYQWTGSSHVVVYAQLRDLLTHWQILHLVVDATGVGAGLTSFLDKAFPGKVIPFVFTAKSKSDLGYGFLAVTDTGRFKDYSTDEPNDLTLEFQRQLAATQYEILEGPARTMRWSVPDGTRDPSTGDLLHDDLVISAALCHILDSLTYPTGQGALIIQARDPLNDIDNKVTW